MLRIKFSQTGLTFQWDEKCLSLSIGAVSHFFLMEAVTSHLFALSRGLARLEMLEKRRKKEEKERQKRKGREGMRKPGIQSAFNIDSNPISWDFHFCDLLLTPPALVRYLCCVAKGAVLFFFFFESQSRCIPMSRRHRSNFQAINYPSS